MEKRSWDAMIGLGSYDLRRPDPWVIGEIRRRAPSGGRVLDLGCGHGRHSAALREAGFRTVGLDNAPSAVENSRRLARSGGPGCFIVRADMGDLPFSPNTFDAVLAWRTCYLQEEEGVRRSAAEAIRVLRPGGFLLASFRSTSNTLVRVGRERGRKLAENTYYLDDGVEFFGVIYRFYSRDGILELFPGCEALDLEERELDHTGFTARRPELKNNFWIFSAFKSEER